MYRKDHVQIAKSIRQSAQEGDLSEAQRQIIAEVFAKELGNSSESFDRELFMAYALSPVLDA